MNEYEVHRQEKVFETRKKDITNKAWIESTREEKGTKSDKLEAREHLRENHQIRTLKEKNEETSCE